MAGEMVASDAGKLSDRNRCKRSTIGMSSGCEFGIERVLQIGRRGGPDVEIHKVSEGDVYPGARRVRDLRVSAKSRLRIGTQKTLVLLQPRRVVRVTRDKKHLATGGRDETQVRVLTAFLMRWSVDREDIHRQAAEVSGGVGRRSGEVELSPTHSEDIECVNHVRQCGSLLVVPVVGRRP